MRIVDAKRTVIVTLELEAHELSDLRDMLRTRENMSGNQKKLAEQLIDAYNEIANREDM